MDWTTLMGLGRGLETFGSSWGAQLEQRRAEAERKAQQDQAFENLLAQMRLTSGLEESPADEALASLTPELRTEYERGRRTEFVTPSGQRRRFYQPYSRTPEGMQAAERASTRQQTITALKQAGLSDTEAAGLADAPPAAVYAALLERKFPDSQRQYDPTRGAIVDVPTGTATPVEGLPARPEPSQRQYDPTRGAIVDVTTGSVTVPAGLPERTSTTAPRTTEGQRKASAFLTQAEDANRIIEEVIAGGKRAPTLRESVTSRLGFGVGNYLTSNEYRRMMSAAMRLADAWLRFTSGAAVPEPEVRRNAMAFLPQPGDDEQTLADKANARRLILRSLQEARGQAGDVDTDTQAMLSPDNPYARTP